MEAFDFAEVTIADFGSIEGAFGAMREALVAKTFGNNDRNRRKHTWKFVLEKFILSPRIETIKNNAFLAGRDKIFGLGNSLATDPVITFGIADHFAELTLGFRSDLDAALFHFFIKHTAKVDFGDAAFGEIVDDGGFTAAAHAENSEKFDVFIIVLHI